MIYCFSSITKYTMYITLPSFLIKLSFVKFLFCLINKKNIKIFRGMLADQMDWYAECLNPQSLTNNNINEY
jgi:hypothetical protein